MKKTIYAKTLNPNYYGSSILIEDIVFCEEQEIIVIPNRDNPSVDVNGYLEDIQKVIDEYNDYSLSLYYNNSIKEFLEYNFNKSFTEEEAKEFQNVFTNKEFNRVDEIKAILRLLTGKEYYLKTLQGYSQSDFAIALIPVETDENYVELFEAAYFGTGIAVMLHEEDFTPNNVDEIIGPTFYTQTPSNYKNLKEIIKEEFGLSSNDDVEVVLYEYEKTEVSYTDYYKLV